MQNQYYQGQSGSGSIYGPPGQTGSGSIYGPPGQTGGGSLYGAQGQNQSYTQNQYTQPPYQQYPQQQQYQQYPPNQFSQPMVQQYQQPQNMGNLTMQQQQMYPPQQQMYPQQQMFPQQPQMYPPQQTYPQQQMFPQQGMNQQTVFKSAPSSYSPQISAGQQFSGSFSGQIIPHIHPVLSQIFANNYYCDMCKKRGDGSICYSCRQCDMDICQNCCSRLLYAPKNNRHQHQLYLTKRSGWVCDICKGRNKNLSMYCQQCDFDCCTNCYSLGYNAVDSCSIM